MISHSRLWRLLTRCGYSHRDIIHLARISESTYRKMSCNEAVRMDVLERVCAALRIDVGDVCSFLHTSVNNYAPGLTHKHAPIIPPQ